MVIEVAAGFAALMALFVVSLMSAMAPRKTKRRKDVSRRENTRTHAA